MEKNLLITAVLFITFIKVCSEENVLNSAMLKQYVFVNAPKEWFKYITKYLQIQLHKKHLNFNEMYISLKTKQLEIKNYSPFWHVSEWKTLICPLGLIRRNSEENRVYPIFRIQLFLDVKLRLNLTFHQIHLEFRHLHNCAVGEIRVISESDDDKHEDFRYCGIHSYLINYPQHRYVYLYLVKRYETDSSKATVYNVTAFYSVIDTKRIVALEKYRLPLRNLVWHLHLVPKDIKVMKFTLRTERYKYFIIKFTNDSDLMVEVFDGPGTHCANIFKKSNESYVTPTFQSIIYMWIPSMKKLNTECGFHFLTNSSSITMNIKLNGSLRILHTNVRHELWKIHSYYYVNLTIINLTYTGFNDPLCTFGGITLYNLNNNSYKEIINQCPSVNDIFTHKDFYSKSNETLLVLYSYQEYGTLNLTIQFSTTKCEPVIINTCALSFLCKFKNNIMCKEHREQIKSTNLKGSKIGTNFPISVNTDECFIFQMVAVTDRLSKEGSAFDCKINFHHVNVLDRRVDIHFNIKAFIQCKYPFGY